MRRGPCIGADGHCPFGAVAVLSAAGKVVHRDRCPTTIPALGGVVRAVARPRPLVIDEGPRAGWLWRHRRGAVDPRVVGDPRRNRLIAPDGDQDGDPDAAKLARLLRGGFVQAVHQRESLERAAFKQPVARYHHRVRQHGVLIREKGDVAVADRPALRGRLPAGAARRELVAAPGVSDDARAEQEGAWRKRLVQSAQAAAAVRRSQELPGVGWARAAALYAYRDTPWRYRSKAALGKYLGIGRERRRWGSGPEHWGVPRRAHRRLQGTTRGAARSAAASGGNPFADRSRRWAEQGRSAKLARRNVARALAAALGGRWRNGSTYRPEWVGAAAAAPTATPAPR